MIHYWRCSRTRCYCGRAVYGVWQKIGGASDDPILGIYNATKAEMWGVETQATKIFERGIMVELKGNGKCELNINGAQGNGTWTLENSKLHIKGGGLDCEGTLANGVMTLTNVLDMGVEVTLEKGDADGEDNTATDTSLQKQWNGTWYGCMHVIDNYDCYMIVDVDATGKGQFAVYLAGADRAFAKGACKATENSLNATDGVIAGGTDMNTYNWMFLPMPDYPDQYTMGDSVPDGEGSFDFTLFMKKWGGSWQKEIDSDFAIVPPSVDKYNAAIENGELPPIGFAPIGYEGTAVSSASQSSTPETTEEPGIAELHEGEP